MASSSSRRLPVLREILLLSFKPRLFPDTLFGVDTESTLRDQAGLIFRAAFEGDTTRMKTLAKQRKKDGKSMDVVEEIRDNQNRSLGALHLAAFAGKLEMCRYLIRKLELDVNAAAEQGSSPLLCAIYGNAPIPIVNLLLNRGADPNKASSEGFTVLHVLATIQDYPDLFVLVEILLSRGAKVDSMSTEGTPLHFAAQCGNAGMMEALLKYNANPDRVVQSFYAPLTLALFASSSKCVELLIEAGADVNAGSPATPLTIAAMDGLADCIKCLLEAGANPNITDEIGRTPLEIAAIHGWKECVQILFPHTFPVARFADWSIDGIMQHVKYGSSEGNLPKSEEPALKVLGDVAFKRKDYTHALALYTKCCGSGCSTWKHKTFAIETDPKDSTLYAKRSLCWLRMGEKDKALDDADTCKTMGLDVSNPCPEQGAALIPTEDYGLAPEALISSLKLDSRSGLISEVSREEDNK